MLDYNWLATVRSRRDRNHLHLEKQRVREGEDRRFPCQQRPCWQNNLVGQDAEQHGDDKFDQDAEHSGDGQVFHDAEHHGGDQVGFFHADFDVFRGWKTKKMEYAKAGHVSTQ